MQSCQQTASNNNSTYNSNSKDKDKDNKAKNIVCELNVQQKKTHNRSDKSYDRNHKGKLQDIIYLYH